jgi:branched-chain amino acid aminotransferase
VPDYVYLNGEYVPADEARVSVFDHGFLYGDGLFETMRSYDGRIFLLEDHLNRLLKSAETLELTIPLTVNELAQALDKLVSLNGDNLYIRLTVTRGPGPVGIDPRLCPLPTIVIMSKELVDNEKLYSEGVKAVFVKTLRNLAGATLPEVKSLNFLNNILAKQEVIKAGADEGFMLNYRGQVTEGTVSNVFMVKGESIFTPETEAGLLVGITRQKVIALAKEDGFVVKEVSLSKEDFAGADEVFFTNSGSEIVPVTVLDDRPVGSGLPGNITQKLLKKYRCCALGS